MPTSAIRHRRQRTGGVRTPRAARRGAVLIVVLVLISLLSLGVYTFAERMMAEAEATATYARGVESRALAESGIELAAATLGTRTPEGLDNFYHDPALFQAYIVQESAGNRGRGRFSLMAPLETDASGRSVRYGMTDESGKLNINALIKLQITDDQKYAMLLTLPGMTEDIADALFDWIDADEEIRPYGCESEYYQTLSPPYMAKNGPVESIEELLLVRGVTPELLFGEDANGNGLLDANENDGDGSPPFDNGDGVLNVGWNAYLTVHSREANRSASGAPKIDLNQSLLTELYDALEPEFGEEIAKYIVAYRMNGPGGILNAASGSGGSGGGGGTGGGGNGVGGRGNGGGGRGGQGSNGQGGNGQGGGRGGPNGGGQNGGRGGFGGPGGQGGGRGGFGGGQGGGGFGPSGGARRGQIGRGGGGGGRGGSGFGGQGGFGGAGGFGGGAGGFGGGAGGFSGAGGFGRAGGG